MKRGNIDKRRAEKRSAVGGVLLFGLFQLACAAGFGALGAIPELPRWLELLFTALAVGCLSLMLPALWALNIRIKEIGRGRSDLDQEEFDMLLVNIDYIPGKDLEVLGIVKGTVVQSKNFGKDFMAGMKTLVGRDAQRGPSDRCQAHGGRGGEPGSGRGHQYPVRILLCDAGGG